MALLGCLFEPCSSSLFAEVTHVSQGTVGTSSCMYVHKKDSMNGELKGGTDAGGLVVWRKVDLQT